MAFLELKGLTKRFGEIAAVENFDLSVERGEFVSLLGPSGCGKTTTLQMIAGFETPSAGSITLEGRDLLAIKARSRGIGIVFQSYALFPHMTVAQNVEFGLEMRKIAAPERRQRVAEALALVHLEALADRYPRAMSGGQRQRVALARALVIRPEILLLDEPLSNLDAKLREEMQLELRGIQQRMGVTTILVTHDQTEAMALSDRVAVMHRGRLVQVARPLEAYEHPRSDFVSSFLGKTNRLEGKVVERAGERAGDLCRVAVGETVFAAPAPPPEIGKDARPRVIVSVRPEKVEFRAAGAGLVDGTVAARIFLGDHWLYQIETPLGVLLVTRQNVGPAEVETGGSVGLAWDAAQVRLLPFEETA
ncbi:putative spermidine/putrescine transport system ATP-binding protein [Tistlia consotensis]|uniref:Putative spermidine/putrescine transport system ATP-binding protein n=1 Tax=Tistlia consotensis USBA 355 TaxID=560819 RepID=A0A1Y6CMU8_9PROT|nr:ABC transporter ATP-binding protein [Tistlia consotensis]SMF77055.1 putative spermidine/putrescine transport system ATP-binding protein [Tistlia consotensis USBA 355]SNS13992.1 putative spermidine/putrescine transport system ATP-binding protein [Tistlia consotensis]